MYILYLTIQYCFYFEQSRTPHWESQVSQQTNNLMVQMWTNLVRLSGWWWWGGVGVTHKQTVTVSSDI